jgi:hypothetical protein
LATKAGRNGDGRHGGRVGGGLAEVLLSATTPRPTVAGGHVPDPAAPDANHHSVTPLPVSPLSSSMYLFQFLFFFNHVDA